MSNRCDCDACKDKLCDERREDPVEIGHIYCHVGNSGATIRVLDGGFGPVLLVHTSAFGNLEQTTEIKLDKPALRKLKELFDVAERFDDYTEEYCHSATLESYDLGNGRAAKGLKRRGYQNDEQPEGTLRIFDKACQKHWK